MFHPNPNNFKLRELVPQSYIAKYGDSAIRFMNPLLMISLQQIRNRFGRMVINSTATQQRGLRTLDFFINQEKPKGGNYKQRALQLYSDSGSQHKFGNAIDATLLDSTVKQVHDYIAANPDEFPFIHFIECDISWLHIDVRNQPNITFWSPNRGTVKVVKQKPIDWSALVEI